MNDDAQPTPPYPATSPDLVPRPSDVGNRLLRHCRRHPVAGSYLLGCLLALVGIQLWSLGWRPVSVP